MNWNFLIIGSDRSLFFSLCWEFWESSWGWKPGARGSHHLELWALCLAGSVPGAEWWKRAEGLDILILYMNFCIIPLLLVSSLSFISSVHLSRDLPPLKNKFLIGHVLGCSHDGMWVAEGGVLGVYCLYFVSCFLNPLLPIFLPVAAHPAPHLRASS